MSFMIRKTFHISALFVMVFSAGALPTFTQSLSSNAIVVYEGARLIPETVVRRSKARRCSSKAAP